MLPSEFYLKETHCPPLPSYTHNMVYIYYIFIVYLYISVRVKHNSAETRARVRVCVWGGGGMERRQYTVDKDMNL